MEFTLKQAKDLVKLFGDDPDSPDETMTVVAVGSDELSHSGPGLYAYCTEYSDEGATLLGEINQVCCNCKTEIEIKNIPGPEDPPPYSCGKPKCDEERNNIMNRIVG